MIGFGDKFDGSFERIALKSEPVKTGAALASKILACPNDAIRAGITLVLDHPFHAWAVVDAVAFSLLNVEGMGVGGLIGFFCCIETGVEFSSQADAVEHGVIFPDISAECEVPQIFRRDVVADSTSHGIGTGEAVGHEGCEDIGAVCAFGDAEYVNAIRIHIPFANAVLDDFVKSRLVERVPPTSEPVIGHAWDEKQSFGGVSLRGEAYLGLPLAGVDVPGVRAFRFIVLSAAVHADVKGAAFAGLWLRAFAPDESEGHGVLAECQCACFKWNLAVFGGFQYVLPGFREGSEFFGGVGLALGAFVVVPKGVSCG